MAMVEGGGGTQTFTRVGPPSGANLDTASNLSSKRRTHILDSDEDGGGHGPGRGIPGKSEFPTRWTDNQTIAYIIDVVRDPSSIWSSDNNPHGVLRTRKGTPTRWQVNGIRDGVEIEVIVEPAGEGIVTAYPTNIPRNP